MSPERAPAPSETPDVRDFVSGQQVRWCPGCGDYAILAQVQKTMALIGVPRENVVFVSGIGCSSRFPYYMNTYGFHSIHGRAPALATGIKCANPRLSVWVVTGDGDALSIGGNHLLHALRRNIGVKILLFNNRIYGLTKGQYSPTTEFGRRTKTSPQGTIEHPVKPLCVALAAEATFVARTVDVFSQHLVETLLRAAAHPGTAFVEIYQNCIVFNNGAFEAVTERSVRDDRLLVLEPGKPMRFGKDRERGIRLKGLRPEVVSVKEAGEGALAVHDPANPDPTMAYLLSQMEHPDHPVPIGVFRDIARPAYEDLLEEQMAVVAKAEADVDLEMALRGTDAWEVK
ncbi:MAG: 2-oxoacid:ferredoxin oxidoreductase subunit beta [Planctomycetota bacterium]